MATKIEQFAQAVGADIKALKLKDDEIIALIGTLSTLKTTAKGSVAAAINELYDNLATATAGGVTISQVEQKIKTAIDSLVGGADSAYDTLKELQTLFEKIQSSDDFSTALTQRLTEINQKITTVEGLVGGDPLTAYTTARDN